MMIISNAVFSDAWYFEYYSKINTTEFNPIIVNENEMIQNHM